MIQSFGELARQQGIRNAYRGGSGGNKCEGDGKSYPRSWCSMRTSSCMLMESQMQINGMSSLPFGSFCADTTV
jgi:hypothetical protein